MCYLFVRETLVIVGIAVCSAAEVEEWIAMPVEPPFHAPSANVAQGVSYTLDPAPNYSYCTDSDDDKQLTDAIYTEGYFWTQKTTVGWSNSQPVVITLDLRAVRPIRGVSYHTAAGRAGVEWPAAIYIFVSDTPEQYHEVGELVSLSARKGSPPNDYATHRFWTDKLRTHGRYLALAVLQTPYIFVDEIEVYLGEPDWTSLPLAGETVPDIKGQVQNMRTHAGVMRRLRQDIEAVRQATGDSNVPEAIRNEITAELNNISREVADLPLQYGDDFRAVLPINPLHERVFRAQSKLWAASGHEPLTVWVSGLWDPLSHVEAPPRERRAEISVFMMLNEYRAGAFNLTNATPDNMEIELRVEGLPGSDDPTSITVHKVMWTDTASGRPVAAALPLAARRGDAHIIHVGPGFTRQVWLTFHPTEVPPSDYRGQISLRVGDLHREIPLEMLIYPLRFPDKPRLRFGGWDYTDLDRMYGVTPENRNALVAHLREHFVDSPWGTSQTLPHGQYDGSGNMTAPPDTAHFDRWLELWPKAAQYPVFAAVSDRLVQWPMGTPEFARAVKAWVTFWANHAREKGVKPEQLALLLVDEPYQREQDVVILAWARAIREAGTGIRVWEDPTYKDMSLADAEMVRACDALCPNRQIFLRADENYREYFAKERERGATLEFYTCDGPARLLDPYTYYRLQPWTCWQYEATASYFWAFADTAGASSWNEYAVERNGYTPLFLDSESVTAGKQLEACREGIEDYEYLAMLRDAVESDSVKNADPELVDQARTLLRDLPTQVCRAYVANDQFRWHVSTDRTFADHARRQILEALVSLQGTNP